jgi:hypothetical protein
MTTEQIALPASHPRFPNSRPARTPETYERRALARRHPRVRSSSDGGMVGIQYLRNLQNKPNGEKPNDFNSTGHSNDFTLVLAPHEAVKNGFARAVSSVSPLSGAYGERSRIRPALTYLLATITFSAVGFVFQNLEVRPAPTDFRSDAADPPGLPVPLRERKDILARPRQTASGPIFLGSHPANSAAHGRIGHSRPGPCGLEQ